MGKWRRHLHYPIIEAMLAKEGLTGRAAAQAIGISDSAFYKKMNGESDFTIGEGMALMRFLRVRGSDMFRLFAVKRCGPRRDEARDAAHPDAAPALGQVLPAGAPDAFGASTITPEAPAVADEGGSQAPPDAALPW